MAASLPEKTLKIPATNWSFSLNPGPFNLKEHVLTTIFANSGSNTVYAVIIITIVKATSPSCSHVVSPVHSGDSLIC